MSLESYLGLDAEGGMSEAALEQLREKMRAAAAQIAAIKREEKKHKKKDEELLKILLHFVKTSHKKELVLLISRVLEQNLPTGFILSVILLGNADIQREVGKFLMLQAGATQTDEKALIFFGQNDQTLPLKIKIEIDNWIKNMLAQAQERPQRLLESAYEFDGNKSLKSVITQLVTFVLRDFLEQNKIDEPFQKLSQFAEFILTGILNKVREESDNRRLIAD